MSNQNVMSMAMPSILKSAANNDCALRGLVTVIFHIQ